jgi:hypothetical protein
MIFIPTKIKTGASASIRPQKLFFFDTFHQWSTFPSIHRYEATWPWNKLTSSDNFTFALNGFKDIVLAAADVFSITVIVTVAFGLRLLSQRELIAPLRVDAHVTLWSGRWWR